MKTKISAIALLILLSAIVYRCGDICGFVRSVFADGSSRARIGLPISQPPEPRLLYPVGEEVVLTGKEFLEFRWQRYSYFPVIDYYDFRLYKGYNMTAANIIVKKRLERTEYSIKVSAGLFEDNQVYTWTLRQVNSRQEKSELAYNSFKVIKK